jgi:DNA-binding PadR family transcriptional regulator
MKKPTNTELALLGLIMEQPRHAYEIEQVIEARNMRDWTEIGFSSIYRLLTGLEKAGWLSVELQPAEGRGPVKKVYHLTEEGRQAWQQGALQQLAAPEHRYSSFLLGLDNLCALPPEEAMEAISQNLVHQRKVHQHFNQAVAHHPLKDDFYISIFFDYILNQMSSEIAWLENLSTRLEKHYRQTNLEEGDENE